MCTEPVVYFEDAGDEHDERDVEGESGGGAGAVHRVDLVAIAGYGAGRDTGLLSVWCLARWDGGEVQYWRDVLHDLINEAHLGCLRRCGASALLYGRRGAVRSERCGTRRNPSRWMTSSFPRLTCSFLPRSQAVIKAQATSCQMRVVEATAARGRVQNGKRRAGNFHAAGRR